MTAWFCKVGQHLCTTKQKNCKPLCGPLAVLVYHHSENNRGKQGKSIYTPTKRLLCTGLGKEPPKAVFFSAHNGAFGTVQTHNGVHIAPCLPLLKATK